MNIEDFGGLAGGGRGTTLAVRAALDHLRGQKNGRLHFPPGRYDFYPDRAVEKYLFVSNNDEGLKRLIFALEGFDDFEIDGQGSQFIFHGFLTPFFVGECKNIRLRNFSVDWARAFHSEAEILAVEGDAIDLRIPAQFPYRIERERLIFTGEAGDTYGINNALEFDPVRRETAFHVTDNYAIRDWHQARQIGPQQVRLQTNWATLPTPGNLLALIDGRRLCPAIVLSDSREIEIEGVTLHHAGGMGVIAQRSSDLTLREVRVSPREGSGRLISLTADATHFVCCEGQITLENCLFENQLDDATNVHGIYYQVVQVISPHELEVRLVHPQQLGIDTIGVGDTLDFVDNGTLNVYSQGIVKAVQRLNRTYSRLHFEAELPTEIQPKHAVLSQRWNPNVSISGCTARGNRARGFLLNSGGKIRVVNNSFHTPGAAILIAGDANYWFESGPVNDVLIGGNTFDDCNFGVWGRAAIDIEPEIEVHRRAETQYHRGIRIEDNLFRAFDQRLVRAHGVEGLIVTKNRLETTETYPLQPDVAAPFDIEGCPDAVIEAPLTMSLLTT